MKTEFTKGKWTVENRFDKNEFGVFSIEIDAIESNQSSIASIWGDTNGVDAEAQANAKLIAEAPMLLRSCWNALKTLEAINEVYEGLVPESTFNELSEVIQKATE